MSWPSGEDLDALLEFAKTRPVENATMVRNETIVYLIENLRRVNQELASQADLLDDLRDRYDELHEDYNKQLRRAKKWKRRYTALVKQKRRAKRWKQRYIALENKQYEPQHHENQRRTDSE